MKKPMDKRGKKAKSEWSEDEFEGRKKKVVKGVEKPAKRIRPQDLHFDDEF